LVGPIPNKAEMCNFTSAQYEDLVLDNDQNYCIYVSKKKMKTKKAKQKASAINVSYHNDHQKSNTRVWGKKPLNRKDRRCQQQQKEVYETICIPDVPERSELGLSAEALVSLMNIPKVAHNTSKKYIWCQKIIKRVFPVIKGERDCCDRTDHQTSDCHCIVSVTYREENPDTNGLNCDLVVSIDDPIFCFVFFEGFNEYLQQEKLTKENFAEILQREEIKGM
jgi:hypothetical protein